MSVISKVTLSAGHALNDLEREQLLTLMRAIKEVNLSGEVFDMHNVLYYIKPDELRKFYVAIFEGKIIGYVYGTIESAICGCLYYIGVREEFRRQGIGKLLVEKLVAQFKKQGIEYIYALSTNQRMTDFVSKLGFKEGEKMTYMKLPIIDKKEFTK